MKFMVLNKEMAIRLAPYIEYSHILISIISPICTDVEFKLSEKCKGLLRLKFHDVDEKNIEIFNKEHDDFIKENPNALESVKKAHYLATVEYYEPMTDEQADQVVEFVEKYKDVELIVVHCEAGISRSAGLAAALSKIMTGDDIRFFKKFLPNMLVYRKIINAYERKKNDL